MALLNPTLTPCSSIPHSQAHPAQGLPGIPGDLPILRVSLHDSDQPTSLEWLACDSEVTHISET